MVTTLQLTRASVNDDATNINLTGVDESGREVEVCFSPASGEMLLAALISALGQSARVHSGNKTLKKVLPLEWWEINPHPTADGVLLSFRLPGGMELTFHIPAAVLPRYEEALGTISGSRTPDSPSAPKN